MVFGFEVKWQYSKTEVGRGLYSSILIVFDYKQEWKYGLVEPSNTYIFESSETLHHGGTSTYLDLRSEQRETNATAMVTRRCCSRLARCMARRLHVWLEKQQGMILVHMQ